MCIIILTGFLGAGKTTLIKSLIAHISAQGQRAAIIVNEVGSIGIDGAVLSDSGGDVYELANGCICCSLSSGLANALSQIEKSGGADVVLIEPSGASLPDGIRTALKTVPDDLAANVRWIALLDPTRLTELMAVLSPMVIAQLQSADFVVVNKIDIATREQIDEAVRLALANVPDTPLIKISSETLSKQQVDLLLNIGVANAA